MADSSNNKLDFTLTELNAANWTSEDDDVRGSSATVELQEKRLVCVEYPAVVKSATNMLATLGGENSVSKTYANPNRRIELRFRPEDPFCHPLCGNRFPSANLLLKVRRRVRKQDPKDVEIHMDLLGVITTTYKFQGMADFQCLAVHTAAGKETSLYDKVILHKSENQAYFEQPMPYFLPPAIFSRLDTPVDYCYRPDSSCNLFPKNNSNFISLNRIRRPNNAIFVSFTDPTVPTECLEAAKVNWSKACAKDFDRAAEERLKEMFASRPIWSRNAVRANINLHPEKMKLLLPVYAYYMVTGPWRSLWVRLGYDPRKDIEAKKYQMLDFRIRCSTKYGYSRGELPVKAKRSSLDYSLPITLNKAAPQPASVMDLPGQEGPSTSRDTAPVNYQVKESSYVFREGLLPPHRQMFYQLCDLDVESIREAIDQKTDDQTECNERDGWCVVGTTDKLRDIISDMIIKHVKSKKQGLPVNSQRSKSQNKPVKSTVYGDDDDDDGEEDENNDEDEEDFQPSGGSENEMETEILDYM